MIPAFLAAVLILASASKNKIYRNPVAFAVPTLEPTVLLVAATGRVREHDAYIPTDITSAANTYSFFIIEITSIDLNKSYFYNLNKVNYLAVNFI